MAKSPRKAAAAAAAPAATKEAEQATAGAQEQEEPSEGGDPNPPPEPPSPAAPPAKAKGEEDKRRFKTLHTVLLTGRFYPSGSEIEITREEHRALVATDSIESDAGD